MTDSVVGDGDPTSGASVDVRSYLEIRTAGPAGWAPGGDKLLVASDLPGTTQAFRLDAPHRDGPPRAVEALQPVTRFDEPVGAGYLPADPWPGNDPDGGAGGDRLLVVADRGGDERHQLYVGHDRPDGPFGGPDDLHPLVVDREYIHRPGGSTRDGRRIAYASNRRDGVAFDTYSRELATGREDRVYATEGWTQPLGFSPDGRYLAVAEPTTEPGDNRVDLVDLALVGEGPVGRGDTGVTELAPHGRSASVGGPSWLPGGDAFFFATDVGREVAGIARGTPDGSWEYVVEPGWDADCAIDWAGRHLLVVWNDDGRTRAELRDPRTLEPTGPVPLPGDGVASGFTFTRDGRYLAFGYSAPSVPGDVWCHDTASGELQRLTVSPCGVDPHGFVDAELVRCRSFDGLEVPAFVYRPAGARGPVPVVVTVHGGPESQARPSFGPITQYLVARGFAVVVPNVRGSTGYGRRYQHLDDVERRLDAVADLAALHDWIATQPDLDETRTALYGGSYGGYMTLAGLAFQPDRWAAGVDIVGMSDLVTFLENTSAWRRAFREREYGSLVHDRATLEAASPINRVEDMNAPLFIVHGANDPRVPLSEAEQIHSVLSRRGVRCDLAAYEDEGHGLSKLPNRVDAYQRIASFLDEVLEPAR
ncbi:S9 family peptidase [Egibacter rhizosphaerae]|uniref:S9 family peptidase n=1 Tax=Egibacter rhizosphaerae TaxID=1670831 RepID=A0A411YKS6_9ACTN|nr:S9 family peptidase [Egibacter rhizosphaerae]QBI21824.1 S9 family peptidase [Egibacter rhizosphaerae]